MGNIRYNWTFGELMTVYDLPLLELLSLAHRLHAQFHVPREVHLCSLISIQTGGCSEDCKYCAQSARYKTKISATPLMEYDEVIAQAKYAKELGATRICLGAAWRQVRDTKQFERVLRIIQGVAQLGVEVCCTLGMLKEHQAKRLQEAGLYAYNHNIDSSENFYKTIVTTRTYAERLQTLDVVSKQGISVCSGGILGMGETKEDRIEFLLTLCTRDPHPESVPINRLTAIPGTPLEEKKMISVWELLRVIATARVTMPRAMIRLSSGRQEMSIEEHALCFFAGVNSIHMGDKLLTVENASITQDEAMIQLLGISKRPAFKQVGLG